MRRRVRGAVHSKPSGQMTMSMRNAASLVPTTYHYKRPPRKRKAVPLEGPVIVGKRVTPSQPGSASKPATPANDDRKSAIVTARRPGRRFADVPDMTPEEHRRRGDAATELWRELVRRATGKD